MWVVVTGTQVVGSKPAPAIQKKTNIGKCDKRNDFPSNH